ncbi:hypothetical protein [Thetidibacter halocola]|uniref:EAL domain-containing protein n=1 Tax=Thetidibacter halocola TaxID=2827239 RepID=A0A8J8B6F9_9RHOB|nr:hypothetical protein [Thetidibacter halocola]MBS0122629.1 hypothetical protein [Thetidibacter halocola]
MQEADVALNASKGRGRNTVVEFEPSMREHSVATALIAEDVMRGLQANEFTVHFQPLLDAGSLEVVGFECLDMRA